MDYLKGNSPLPHSNVEILIVIITGIIMAKPANAEILSAY